jgi:serine/threonine protein kinase
MSEPPPFPLEFDDYRLERRLAVGGMSELYCASRTRAGGGREQLALKLLLPHLCDQAEIRGLFANEARITLWCSHPNVVRAVDSGVTDGRPYLALELLSGRDLGEVAQLSRSRLCPVPWPAAVRVVASACAGLHHAHELSREGRPLNLVHRDVSPSNLMICTDGLVKLLDFGLARADGLADPVMVGAALGVAAYTAPEQLWGMPLDRRADIFSLGVILHELLTGRRLFWRGSDAATMLAVVESPIPAPSSVRGDLPDALDGVVARALERDRERRYSSAVELQDVLSAFAPNDDASIGNLARTATG